VQQLRLEFTKVQVEILGCEVHAFAGFARG